MKHLKVTSALLAAIMCVSMTVAPVAADETETPSETQTTEVEDKNDSEETEESEEKDPEISEDRPLEAEDQNEALDAVLAKGKCGKKVKWTLDKKGTLKISGKGAMNQYVFDTTTKKVTTPWVNYLNKIKKVVVSKGVTFIGQFAFDDCKNLTSVSLPNKLKGIDYAAFSGCDKLKKITIPKSVRTIGSWAFSNTGLESVTIPNGVTDISYGTFSGCKNLKSVTIPASVKYIGTRAFDYCYSLTTVKIPVSGLNKIGNNVFYKCSNLGEFKIPLSVTSIGESVFAGCTNLKRVWINVEQKEKLSPNVFADCPNVDFDVNKYNLIGKYFDDQKIAYVVTNPAINGTGTVDVISINPEVEHIVVPAVIENNGVKYKVTRITDYSRNSNPDLKMKTLVIGSNVTSIADKAFENCPELISVTGGAKLISIGARAFENCPKLRVFKIVSKKLKKIGPFAFSGDKALKTLQVKKTTKLTKSGVKNALKGSSVKTVKVKKSKVKKYKKFFKKKNCGKKVKVKK